ncbi:hypothetical protein FN846DRAFT_1009336 [Sphaerosporella brunnea]|uniref:Uncharacterized protein n=1 Tax=Sphaerosporella brunnea TaxID=1250544 RepID=A0A5J5ECK1_9PEZI|nr:hypothetical protein FN846DRAFT_1009336 [Sphaerosporella brunnea]
MRDMHLSLPLAAHSNLWAGIDAMWLQEAAIFAPNLPVGRVCSGHILGFTTSTARFNVVEAFPGASAASQLRRTLAHRETAVTPAAGCGTQVSVGATGSVHGGTTRTLACVETLELHPRLKRDHANAPRSAAFDTTPYRLNAATVELHQEVPPSDLSPPPAENERQQAADDVCEATPAKASNDRFSDEATQDVGKDTCNSASDSAIDAC